MIAVIQGSNRLGNASMAVVQAISAHLTAQGEAVEIVDMVHLPSDVLHNEMYANQQDHPFLNAAEETLRAADKWIFVFPEYNGSFPGALKLFIDALSVRNYKSMFGGKVAALIGTASGRSGNLRGLDHFASVLNHLGTTVMPQSLPISLIDGLLDKDRNFTNEASLSTLQAHIGRFLSYSSTFVA